MADYFVDCDDVLENKLGVTDSDELKAAEQEIVTNRTADALSDAPQVFDLGNLLHVHKVLFEDIYGFAGKIRTVDIAKYDASVPFAHAQFIEAEARRIFQQLEDKEYLVDLGRRNFIIELTKLAAELNALHPFREGNGRAIRLFLIMLADHAGYLLDYSQVSAEEIIRADKLAFEGDDKLLLSLYNKVVAGS